MTRSNQWRMVAGDVNWKDYGATYGRWQDKDYMFLAVFTNLWEHDTDFENQFLLQIYQEHIGGILSDTNLLKTCKSSGIDLESLRFKNNPLLFKQWNPSACFELFEALVSYGSYSGSSDDYYGDNAYKLFKQAGIKPFN